MAKKRKGSGRGAPSGPKEFDEKDGKLGPITSYRDVADEEDDFHINRDKVMLDEGPEAKRQRKWAEQGMFDAIVSIAPINSRQTHSSSLPMRKFLDTPMLVPKTTRRQEADQAKASRTARLPRTRKYQRQKRRMKTPRVGDRRKKTTTMRIISRRRWTP